MLPSGNCSSLPSRSPNVRVAILLPAGGTQFFKSSLSYSQSLVSFSEVLKRQAWNLHTQKCNVKLVWCQLTSSWLPIISWKRTSTQFLPLSVFLENDAYFWWIKCILNCFAKKQSISRTINMRKVEKWLCKIAPTVLEDMPSNHFVFWKLLPSDHTLKNLACKHTHVTVDTTYMLSQSTIIQDE